MLSKYEPFHLFPVPAQMAASCRRTVKPPVECRIWWRNGASWWMRRQARSID
jgi:hypothetical protein